MGRLQRAFIEIKGFLFCPIIAIHYTLMKGPDPVWSVLFRPVLRPICLSRQVGHNSFTESHFCVVDSVLLQKLLLTVNSFTSPKILVLSLTFQFPSVVSQLGSLVRKALKQKKSKFFKCTYPVTQYFGQTHWPVLKKKLDSGSCEIIS